MQVLPGGSKTYQTNGAETWLWTDAKERRREPAGDSLQLLIKCPPAGLRRAALTASISIPEFVASKKEPPIQDRRLLSCQI